MFLIFLGPPGAGKGTYSKILSKKLGIPVVSTGDLFREAIASNSKLGNKVKKYVESGELVPDDITLMIIEERLNRDDAKNGVIFDGFPRNVNQAKLLDEVLLKINSKVDIILDIQASDEIIIQRLSSRRICPKCGAVYNLISSLPKKDELCDNCSTPIIQRADDEPETIKKRLNIYRQQTAPLLEYYNNKARFVYVDSSGLLEDVVEAMFEKLRKMEVLP